MPQKFTLRWKLAVASLVLLVAAVAVGFAFWRVPQTSHASAANATSSLLGIQAKSQNTQLQIQTKQLHSIARAGSQQTVKHPKSVIKGNVTEVFTAQTGTILRELAVAPNGDVWFGGDNGVLGHVFGNGTAVGIVAVPPEADGSAITVERLVIGPDGNVWFLDKRQAAIETYNVATGNFTRFPITTFPEALTVGPDGALWFASFDGSQKTNVISRITVTGQVTSFTLPHNSFGITSLAAGAKNTIWFVLQGIPGVIGRLTVDGQLAEFLVGTPKTPVIPFALTKGPDGNIWFTNEISVTQAIFRITDDGFVKAYPISANAGAEPFSIIKGPDGALWFTLIGSPSIGRITTNGVNRFFSLLMQQENVLGIAASKNAIWVTANDDSTETGSVFVLK